MGDNKAIRYARKYENGPIKKRSMCIENEYTSSVGGSSIEIQLHPLFTEANSETRLTRHDTLLMQQRVLFCTCLPDKAAHELKKKEEEEREHDVSPQKATPPATIKRYLFA